MANPAPVGTVRVPVSIGDEYCTVDMVMMDGPGPMLLSVNVLAAMNAMISFKTGTMRLGEGRQIQLDRLQNGHYFIDLYKPLQANNLSNCRETMKRFRETGSEYKDSAYSTLLVLLYIILVICCVLLRTSVQ